ncbi:hypothetical protein BKA69DRAFT_1031634 [Paraphysoderma sedebokerense]|nr:hypothetical protein BKA69DRAFT_1031634 [Paraphysoderma sedebokerense]
MNQHSPSSVSLSELIFNSYSFIDILPRDKLTPDLMISNPVMRNSRQVEKAAYSFVMPEEQPNPSLVSFSEDALSLIDIDQSATKEQLFLEYFSGNRLIPGSKPWSHCYAGHQFGHFAGQLGDGRAISLGEYVNAKGERWELQLKGAGRTPYSRFGDGYAVLRSSIREFLCSEHFAALKIPTSRALSLIHTTRPVRREMVEDGAVVCRMAPSWVRFGSFEIFLYRDDLLNLKKLADYVTQNLYGLELSWANGGNPYLRMFEEVTKRTAELMALWMVHGWQHGVMNTDNFSILGLTIDYGPFGFLDTYDPTYVANHSDESGRYSFENQPQIGLWNLNKLANCLVELCGMTAEDVDLFERLENSEMKDIDAAMKEKWIKSATPRVIEVLKKYENWFMSKYTNEMRKKLGLTSTQPNDFNNLIQPLLRILELAKTDYTIFFRALSSYNPFAPISLEAKHNANTEIFNLIFGNPLTPNSEPESMFDESILDDVSTKWKDWIEKYNSRIVSDWNLDPSSDRLQSQLEAKSATMKQVNPKFILRNWIAQVAIDAAEKGDYSVVENVKKVMTDPFSDIPKGMENVQGWEQWAGEVPEWGKGIQCSCSS